MRAVNIIFIVLSFFFLIVMTAGTFGTKSERDRYYERLSYSQDYDSGYSYEDYGDPAYVKSTRIAVTMSFVFFVFSLTRFVLNFLLVKTSTSRVLAIIGLVLTLALIAWGAMALDSPRSISFDEIGGAWILYAVVCLVFAIIGTVQAFSYYKLKHPTVPFYGNNFQQPYPPVPPFQQNPYPPYQPQPNPYQQPYYPPQQNPAPQNWQQPNYPPQNNPPQPNWPQPNPYQQPNAPQPPSSWQPPNPATGNENPPQPYQPPQPPENPWAPKDPPPADPSNPWAPKP